MNSECLFRVLCSAGLALSSHALIGAGPNESALLQAWSAVERYEYREAEKRFRELAAVADDSAGWVQLGNALLLMNRQPRLRSNFDRAESLLFELQDRAADPRVAAAAGYFLARLLQSPAFGERLDAAEAQFARTFEVYPNELFGQMSAAKLASLVLFQRTTPETAERFARVEAFGPALTIPAAQRSYHWAVGQAYLRFELDPVRARHHLLRCHALGLRDQTSQRTILVQLALLGREQGDIVGARAAAQELLRRFPFDARAGYFRAWLEEIADER